MSIKVLIKMISIPEFIFLNVVTHIYILFLLRSLEITYETFVLKLCAVYFVGTCFVLGIRIVSNTMRIIKKK